jgi:glycosyltransferase involved in cell wall biosynthesis
MNISVALCTYNGEKYLAEQLGSILNQTCPVSEIIICDDRSSDRSIEIINELSLQHKGIIQLHINDRNLGGKKNFEKAFGLTTGDIIFFSDQDDVWESNKVELMVKALVDSPDSLGIFTDAYLISEVGERYNYSFLDSLSFTDHERRTTSKEHLCRYILRYGNIVAGSMLAVKKECKKNVLPFHLMDFIWHDEWIALMLSSEFKLSYLDLKLINYRLHSEQQIGAGNDKSIAAVQNFKMLNVFENQIKFPLQYFNYIWHTYNRVIQYGKELKTLEPLVLECKNDAFQAKKRLVLQYGFFTRKAKLCKWFFNRQFETSFKEVVGYKSK